MRATIVTPWRGKRAELERDYWNAIRKVDADVVIIDDGSEPPLPNAVRIERSGFARACNTGLQAAQTEAVVFLNNDVAAAGDWLTPLLELLEPGVLVGAELQNGPHAYVDDIPFPYLEGWCLGGLTAELRDLGGFDETFEEPSYYGDNDLCLRARAAGMTLRESRQAARLLCHKRNQTAGTAADPQVQRASAINRETYRERARALLAAA